MDRKMSGISVHGDLNGSGGYAETQEEWMESHVNFALQITDTKLRHAFQKFHATDGAHLPLVTVGFFLVFVFVPWICAFLFDVAYPNHFAVNAPNSVLWSLLFAVVIFFAFVYCFTSVILHTRFKNVPMFIRIVPVLRTITCIGLTVCVCCHLFLRVFSGGCDTVLNTWTCNPNHQVGTLPADSVLMLFVMPRLLILLIYDAPVLIHALGITLSLITLIVCASWTNFHRNFLLITIVVLGTGIILVCSQFNRLRLFCMYEHLRHTLVSHEKNADERHANELRAMIGNVAHDLKTVSTFNVIFSSHNLTFLFLFTAVNFIFKWSGIYYPDNH
jgi:hypothetical protein